MALATRVKHRVFIGFGDICGYYSQLEQGLLELGVECTLVNAYPDRDYERSTRPIVIGRLVESLGRRRAEAPRGSLRRHAWSALQAVSMAVLLAQAVFAFDTFIFSGGTTFFFQRDLRLLKLFKKKVIVVFHGTDSRPPYLNAAVVGTAGDVDVPGCLAETRITKDRVRRVDKYADIVVNHSMNAHFHERPIINWLHIGIPFRLSHAPRRPVSDRNEVHIVHAPTRPGPKGTPQIEQAISRLQARGHRIRFTKLVGRTPDEVLAAIADCDFVVDELFSDTTMASFATEAAAFGKPAVVGLEGFEKLRRYTSNDAIPPAAVCRADQVEATIEKLVVDPEYRIAIGQQARRFLEDRWSVRQVAERFVRLMAHDIPDHWWFDPRQLDYLHGWGLTDRRAREVLRTLIAARGVGVLALQDKPRLEQMCIQFASPSCEPAEAAAMSVQ
jgi:glycosyltransferase involved in cell wall biosynthesis